MPRRFRLWEKKRGHRLTGSRWIGSAGEAVFFAALSVFGVITLFALAHADYAYFETGDQARLWNGLILFVLISLTAIGVIGFVYSLVISQTSIERRRALAKRATDIDLLSDQLPSPKEFPNIPRYLDLTNSPGIRLKYRLPIANSPGWKLLLTTIFCLIWNALVAVLVWWAIKAFRAGQPDWYLVALVVPFGVFGLGVMAYLFRALLLATAIGPTSLEISNLPLIPGNRYEVFLTQAGRLFVRSIMVTLVCEEEATFSQGTDTRTERRRVYQQPVFTLKDFEILPSAPCQHLGELDFPKHVMHSFQSDHNAVSWKLEVRGIVDKWPEFQRNFPIVVFPSNAKMPSAVETNGSEHAA